MSYYFTQISLFLFIIYIIILWLNLPVFRVDSNKTNPIKFRACNMNIWSELDIIKNVPNIRVL